MRVEGREESTNVEDARGAGMGGMAVGGGLIGIVVLLLASILGINPKLLENIGMSGGADPKQKPPEKLDPVQEARKTFTGVVLKDTETVWTEQFQEQLGKTYKLPKLKLYTGAVQSACGFAQAAVGPFYCPGDEKVYLDLSFFDELATTLKAGKGDFGMAYVIAHEIGHHIQTQLGPPDKRTPYIVLVNNARGTADENKMQVRLELQADYLAGVWAHHANKRLKVLEPGDDQEAVAAAMAVGDDVLQKRSRGYVQPESFTHGSAKQRAAWFMKGFQTGRIDGMHDLFSRRYEDLDRP